MKYVVLKRYGIEKKIAMGHPVCMYAYKRGDLAMRGEYSIKYFD